MHRNHVQRRAQKAGAKAFRVAPGSWQEGILVLAFILLIAVMSWLAGEPVQ